MKVREYSGYWPYAHYNYRHCFLNVPILALCSCSI